MSDEYYPDIPQEVLNDLAKHCHCCFLCGQSRPCDGVLAGGFCDDLCDCEDDD